MKSRLLLIVWSVLALIPIPLSAGAADATSDEINAAIVQETNVYFDWTNDGTYPWSIVTLDGQEILMTNRTVPNNEKSIVSFTYTSSKVCALSFQWCRDYRSSEYLNLIIDGKQVKNTRSYNWNSVTYFIPAGTHVVSFEDELGSNSSSGSYWGGCAS